MLKKENNMIKKIINKNDLIALGYKTNTAMTIIRQAKKIMVQKGYAFYNNHRLCRLFLFGKRQGWCKRQ